VDARAVDERQDRGHLFGQAAHLLIPALQS
jgi:hypothetical protein